MSTPNHVKGIWIMLNVLDLELRQRRCGRPLARGRTLKRVREWLPKVTELRDGRYAIADVEERLCGGKGRDALNYYGFRVTEDFEPMAAVRLFEEGRDIHDIYELCEPSPFRPRGERERTLAA